MIHVRDLGVFEDFIRLLAGRVGQLLNIHSMSNDLGISSPTITQWLSILEASFIVFRLRPYYENFGKRIIKASKIFFTDVGLVSYLLGIENPEQVSRDPLLGGLFENMVVMEAVKARLNRGLEPNLYFFRDNNGNEVDLIYKRHNSLIPIEIKAAMTFNERLTKGIGYFHKISNKAEGGYLIYAGELNVTSRTCQTVHFTEVSRIFS
jgi:predicted AAA+ superfamily ATPase